MREVCRTAEIGSETASPFPFFSICGFPMARRDRVFLGASCRGSRAEGIVAVLARFIHVEQQIIALRSCLRGRGAAFPVPSFSWRLAVWARPSTPCLMW